jgi:hypothetical protein
MTKIANMTNPTNQTSETESKVFSEWDTVDCNGCSHYWDDSCSGVPKDKKRNCSSFVATRRVVIPEQIRELEKQIKNLKISVTLLWIVVMLLNVCVMVLSK